MKISTKTADAHGLVTIELSSMEVTALRAALAEVCYGFYIPNFEDHMGNTEAKAQQLFEKFDILTRISRIESH